jgi:type II secretory pathway pseudopilin PulG
VTWDDGAAQARKSSRATADKSWTRPRPGGFTYVAMLFLVVLMGVALAALTELWSTTAKREREAQLLFVGGQFRKAIENYRTANPNVGDGYPKDFQALLLDPNVPVVKRYLRQVYVDPMTGTTNWGLVKTPSGSIVGVYSQSKGQPLKTANFPDWAAQFADATTYSGWIFAPSGSVTPTPSAEGATPATGQQPLAPATVMLPAPPVAAPAPATDANDRCAGLERSDSSACSSVERRYGSLAANQCYETARQRVDICRQNDGTPMPSLRTNF